MVSGIRNVYSLIVLWYTICPRSRLNSESRGEGLVAVPARDLRPLFTERTAARVRPGVAMTRADRSPTLILDNDAIRLLRDGIPCPPNSTAGPARNQSLSHLE